MSRLPVNYRASQQPPQHLLYYCIHLLFLLLARPLANVSLGLLDAKTGTLVFLASPLDRLPKGMLHHMWMCTAGRGRFRSFISSFPWSPQTGQVHIKPRVGKKTIRDICPLLAVTSGARKSCERLSSNNYFAIMTRKKSRTSKHTAVALRSTRQEPTEELTTHLTTKPMSFASNKST